MMLRNNLRVICETRFYRGDSLPHTKRVTKNRRRFRDCVRIATQAALRDFPGFT
jgi:hypothetical protein